MSPNRDGRIFVPTNPHLADIVGRTDLDFENFHVFNFLDSKVLDFQVPRFPKLGLGRAWPLGRVAGLSFHFFLIFLVHG